MTNAKKSLIYKIISVLMVIAMFMMTGCWSDGGTSDPTSNSERDSQTTSDGNSERDSQSESDKDTESGSDSQSSSESQGYNYGEDWLDVYDAEYTQKLLDMGEQYFTTSQLSSVFDGGTVKAKGVKKKSKYVGIFYFLWLGDDIGGIYDISKLLEQYNPYDLTNPLWALEGSANYDAKISPKNGFHYFEEPLYGYYRSTDKWVIRRHLELLTLAGIDFLYLDFTNANMNGENAVNIYKNATIALMDTILEMQAEGFEVPRIVPICCNPYTSSDDTVRTRTTTKVIEWVYNNYYAVNNFKYKSCWFTADKTRNPSGKPLLVTYSFDKQYLTNEAVADAFWIRNVVWPTAVTPGSYANGFPWMDYSFPQKNYNGIMNVSVAQHIDGNWSSEAFLARNRKDTAYKYRGRGALPNQTYAYQTDSVDGALMATNFVSEWNNVHNYGGSDEVWMVTVTGWNEWVAQKLNQNGRYATFVDTFSIAFSRDVEMMRDADGYGDTYFLNLVENVRKFKYEDGGKASSAAMWMRQTVDYKNISAWDNVKAKYIDFTGDATNRNAKSIANKYTYTDNTARNDIDYIKIANDSEYLYVLAATKNDVTAYEQGDKGWMNLWISAGGRSGWCGYDFVINRSPKGTVTSIESLGTTADGEIVAATIDFDADIYTEGKFVAYRIPLEALGVTSASEIGIKVSDNIFAGTKTETNDGVGVYSFGDIFAFYCGGDCAPAGRLNYSYRMGY